MHEHELQLVEMRIFAGFWSLVDLDPTRVVNLTLPDNTVVPMAIGDVPDYPDVAWAIANRRSRARGLWANPLSHWSCFWGSALETGVHDHFSNCGALSKILVAAPPTCERGSG